MCGYARPSSGSARRRPPSRNHPTYRRFLANHLTLLIGAAKGLGDAAGEAEAIGELATLRDSDPEMVALDARLSAILRGDSAPKDQAERLRLAQRAYDKALHASAARIWGEALAADPKLGDDRQAEHRYNAACSASLAGCGKGKDDPSPDDAARAKLRRQALDWLKAELANWARVLDSGPPNLRAMIAPTLDHWKKDADLAGIRDETELARLPEAECREWRSFWVEVDAMISKVACH